MTITLTRRELRQLGLEPHVPAKRVAREVRRIARVRPTLRADEFFFARGRDCLTMTLPTPPRTKKNHGRGVAKESAAYVQYALDVKTVVAPVLPKLALRARPYNIAALFYVDAGGEQADAVGLYQALADALQNAGVIPNDRWLRRWWGSDVVPDRARPRVELTITPIAPP